MNRYEKNGPESVIAKSFQRSITSTFSFLIWKLPYLSFLGDTDEETQSTDKVHHNSEYSRVDAVPPQRLLLEPVRLKTGRSNWICHSIAKISNLSHFNVKFKCSFTPIGSRVVLEISVQILASKY